VSLQKGYTPLRYAVSHGHASIVKYLVKVAHADQSKVSQVTITQTMMMSRKNYYAICMYYKLLFVCPNS